MNDLSALWPLLYALCFVFIFIIYTKPRIFSKIKVVFRRFFGIFHSCKSFPPAIVKGVPNILQNSYKWNNSLANDSDLFVLDEILENQCSVIAKDSRYSYYHPSPGVAFAVTLSCLNFLPFHFSKLMLFLRKI